MITVRTDLSWLRVLVVDDEPQVMRTVREMLRDMGVRQSYWANDGKQALEFVERHGGALHLIIADWNMPKMTGIELLTRVRETNPDIGFLLLTGRADAESVLQAREQGVSGYMCKPFSAEQLRAKLVILAKHIEHAKNRDVA
jgi:two-component system, chemotaxis family, chemotaxis protein CheY